MRLVFVFMFVTCINFLFADSVTSNPAFIQSQRNSGNQFSYGRNGTIITNTQQLGSQNNYYGTNSDLVGKSQTTANGSLYYYNKNGQITGYSLK